MLGDNYLKSDFGKRIEFLKQILLKISLFDTKSQLIFLGGTSLMLFYKLPRFSEDLDFSMQKFDIAFAKKLHNGLFSMGYKTTPLKDLDRVASFSILYQIGNNDYECKIEIGKRKLKTSLSFNLIPFLNSQINLISLPQNHAQKIAALIERGERDKKGIPMGKPKGRDAFDIYFYLSIKAPIDYNIIRERLKINSEKELFLKIAKKLIFLKAGIRENLHNEIAGFSFINISPTTIISSVVNSYLSRIKASFRYEAIMEMENGNPIIPLNNLYYVNYHPLSFT